MQPRAHEATVAPTARQSLTTQHEKATYFRELHQHPGAFVIANAWDGGSARMLAGLGFPALATSSGGRAYWAGWMEPSVVMKLYNKRG